MLVAAAGAGVEDEEPTLEYPGLSLGEVPAPKFTLGTGVGDGSTEREETVDTAADGDPEGSETDEGVFEEDENGCGADELVDAFVPETPEPP